MAIKEAETLEKLMHQQFRDIRISRESFKAYTELLAYIAVL
jgi:hypothetical protein